MRRFLEGGNLKFPPTVRRKQDFQYHCNFSHLTKFSFRKDKSGDLVSLYNKLHFILSFSSTCHSPCCLSPSSFRLRRSSRCEITSFHRWKPSYRKIFQIKLVRAFGTGFALGVWRRSFRSNLIYSQNTRWLGNKIKNLPPQVMTMWVTRMGRFRGLLGTEHCSYVNLNLSRAV